MTNEVVLRVMRTAGAHEGWTEFRRALMGTTTPKTGDPPKLERLDDGRYSLTWTVAWKQPSGDTAFVRHCRVVTEPLVGGVFSWVDEDTEELADVMPWMFMPEDFGLAEDTAEPTPGTTEQEHAVMIEVINAALLLAEGRTIDTTYRAWTGYKFTEFHRARAKMLGLTEA